MAPEFSRSGARYRAYNSKHLDELTALAMPHAKITDRKSVV